MLALILINYLCGLGLERFEQNKTARLILLLIALAGSLGMLFYFKYANFVLSSINAIFGTGFAPIQGISVLPLGISFYTFQTLSYTIDVYRRDVKTEHNIIDFGAYVVMFPQLIAGPIVKYRDVSDRLHVYKGRYELKQIEDGMTLFTFGLAKKVLLADAIGALWTDIIGVADSPSVSFVGLANASTPLVWLGVIAYSLQLYFDFSGYSLMGIGMGRMLGFDFPQNFNYPYISGSITEFWRRWHMTLSGWFRDYLYIPLGGSRCRLRRTCLNLLIVFTLTGLWHGAAWQYVVFGLLHGVILCLERLGLGQLLNQMPKFFRHLYTVAVLWATLIIFGAPGLREGLAAWRGILTWQSGARGYTLAAFADTKLLLILAASFLLCGPLQALSPRLKKALYERKAPSPAGMVLLLVLLFLGLMRVTAGTYSAFIYFQF